MSETPQPLDAVDRGSITSNPSGIIQAIPTFTTYPEAHLRHNISDEELTVLSTPSSSNNFNNALWGSAGASISLAPNGIAAAAQYCKQCSIDPLSMLNIVFLFLSIGVAVSMYFVCKDKKTGPEKKAEDIRARTARQN